MPKLNFDFTKSKKLFYKKKWMGLFFKNSEKKRKKYYLH